MAYGDFGAGGYTSLAQKIGLPQVLSPSLPSLIPTKAPPLVTSTVATPNLSIDPEAVARQGLSGAEAAATTVADTTENQAIGSLTFQNPITGI